MSPIWAAGFFVCLIFGAPPAASAAGRTVAVFTKNQTNPFFKDVRIGAEKAAASLGFDVLNYVPTKPDNLIEQLSQVEDVVVKRPKGILFTPVDARAMAQGVAKINASGIPVVNVSERLASGEVVSFVGAADHDLGVASARNLLATMGGRGRVIIIEGVKGSPSGEDRLRGYRDVIAEFPDVEVLASQPGNFQRRDALMVMDNLLQRHPKVDGVLAANDAMAIGAVQALSSANRTALVAGINGTEEAVRAVIRGTLLSTTSSQPFEQGCIAMMVLVRAIEGRPVFKEKYMTPLVITKANAADFDVPVDGRNCPTWDAATSDKH